MLIPLLMMLALAAMPTSVQAGCRTRFASSSSTTTHLDLPAIDNLRNLSSQMPSNPLPQCRGPLCGESSRMPVSLASWERSPIHEPWGGSDLPSCLVEPIRLFVPPASIFHPIDRTARVERPPRFGRQV
jgi:hypothetical protein